MFADSGKRSLHEAVHVRQSPLEYKKRTKGNKLHYRAGKHRHAGTQTNRHTQSTHTRHAGTQARTEGSEKVKEVVAVAVMMARVVA